MVLPCDMDYSKGNGTGVAEAVGNWGFSHGVSSKGHELQRLQCIVDEIDSLRGCPPEPKPPIKCFKRGPPCVKPSPKECQPAWMDPMKRPLMTYSSVSEVIVVGNLKASAADLAFPIPGRYYYQQGSDKWYKVDPNCCPQPTCVPVYQPCCEH